MLGPIVARIEQAADDIETAASAGLDHAKQALAGPKRVNPGVVLENFTEILLCVAALRKELADLRTELPIQ